MSGDPGAFPAEIEPRLLAILDLPDGDQDRAIADLVAAFPAQQQQIREWVRLALQPDSHSAPGVAAAQLPAIPGYRVLERLGHGGMGEVFLAEHVRLGRRVALKMIRGDLLGLPGARQRFEREARVASRLDHEGICKVWEVGEHDGRPFLAMQWIRGRTLADEIRRQRDAGLASTSTRGSSRAAIDAAVALLEKVARALHAAHEAGLVHRDVKPGNVMVRDDGEPVLLDFGLARDLADEGSATASHDLLGTPRYMAPEQVQPRGRRAERRTDVYALGVLAYESLTLQPPFLGRERTELFAAIVRGDCVRPRRLLPAIPRDLEIVIECAMDRDPARRYATALELAEELRRVREREPILARPAGPLLRLRRWQQRHPVRAAALAMLLLLLATTSVFLVHLRGAKAESDRLREAIAEMAIEAIDSLPSEAGARFLTGIQHVERATDRVPEHVFALARVEALEGAFAVGQVRTELAALAAREDPARPVARVQLRIGQEEMANDVGSGRARIRKALELHRSGRSTLPPVEVELASAWLSDDLDDVVSHLRAGSGLQPGHVPTMSLLIPALLFRGRASEVLELADLERGRLAPSFLLLPRYLAKVMLGRRAEADTLIREVRRELGEPVGDRVEPLAELLFLMQDQLACDTERLVGALAGQSVPKRGDDVRRALALVRKWNSMQKGSGDLWHLLDGGLLLRAHPAITQAYSRLPTNPVAVLADPRAAVARAMQQTIELFPDSLCVALHTSSFLGKSSLPVAEKFAEALRLCDVADQEFGLTGSMSAVRRYRAYLRIASLSTWLGDPVADAPLRLELEQKLVAAIDKVIGVEGLTETEFRAYEIVAGNRLTSHKWGLVGRILVSWERAHGATTRLAIGRADSFIAMGAKDEARRLLEDILQREPDHAEAKALLPGTR